VLSHRFFATPFGGVAGIVNKTAEYFLNFGRMFSRNPGPQRCKRLNSDWSTRDCGRDAPSSKTTDTVPIAVPALLRTEWWPMISFVVFKSPAEGRTHIFRPGEPMMQFLILPVTADFTLAPMDAEEAAERELRGRRIHASRPTLAAESTWVSRTDTVFDGTYRHLLRAAKAKEKEG
jgi:hypothetical protein